MCGVDNVDVRDVNVIDADATDAVCVILLTM